MDKKKVVLVRHGETAWSLSGQHTGLTDIPLTENGEKQAEALSKELASFSFSHALVSPLQRAHQTFLLSKLSIPYTIDTRLVEWNYGVFEGKTSKEIQKTFPSWNIFVNGALEGESVVDIQKRADLIIAAALAIEGDIVLFSSGHILRSIAARWISYPIDFGKHLPLQTSSVSILGYEHDIPAIIEWNKVILS